MTCPKCNHKLMTLGRTRLFPGVKVECGMCGHIWAWSSVVEFLPLGDPELEPVLLCGLSVEYPLADKTQGVAG